MNFLRRSSQLDAYCCAGLHQLLLYTISYACACDVLLLLLMSVLLGPAISLLSRRHCDQWLPHS
jgi:hypothetical protein